MSENFTWSDKKTNKTKQKPQVTADQIKCSKGCGPGL